MNRFVDRDMALRYHWALGIGHIYAHSKEHDGIRNRNFTLQQGRSQATANPLYMKTHNDMGSTTRTRDHFLHLDNANDDEAAELTLGNCEVIDWDLDGEDDVEANKANGGWDEGEEEHQDDMYEELGSEPEWTQDVE
jgi:hypothetical protein